MPLVQQTVIDKIEILEDGTIQVRRARYVIDTATGDRIAGPQYHRVAYYPGQSIPAEDAKVRRHAESAWTDEVVTAYKAQQAAQRSAMNGTQERLD